MQTPDKIPEGLWSSFGTRLFFPRSCEKPCDDAADAHENASSPATSSTPPSPIEMIYTSHLRGGAGPGRASCIGGATFSHQQKSSTPLKLMQFGESHVFFT
ncbi:hypothetical protein PUN28_015161 [Cardiocondyla obscurior]|uniref:Uncharacterized protein n=1 Tax=Cardiocondyla obscurior TaxID=286306 RepID=A0AAW2EXB7_9HYME